MKKTYPYKLFLIVLIFIGSPFACYYLARFTYHQGWWGRDNLLARSLWLCSAPASLETTFYSKNIDVLVPACENARGTSQRATVARPSHQFIEVFCNDHSGKCLLNVVTKEKRPTDLSALLPDDRGIDWLRDDLVVVANGDPPGGYFLVDLITGQRAPLADLGHLGLVSEDRILNQEVLLDVVGQGGQVYIIEDVFDTVYVVSPDIWAPDSKTIRLEESWFGESNIEAADRFFEENDIAYIENKRNCGSDTVSTDSEPLPSPSGRLVAWGRGIYDAQANILLMEYGLGAQPFGEVGGFVPCFWLPDESAVVISYTGAFVPALIAGPHDTGQDPGFLLRIPQPVLKFNLPEELRRINPLP